MTADQSMPTDLQKSEQLMRRALGPSEDIHYEHVQIGTGPRDALLIFVPGMAERESIERNVVRPLAEAPAGDSLPRSLPDLGRALIHMSIQRVETDPANVRDAVYQGQTAVLVDGYVGAILIEAHGWPERKLDTPASETGLRGPRDGFVEDISTNLVLIRRRLSDPNLTIKFWRVGRRSQTRVAVVYLNDIAKPRLVEEIKSRVAAVEYDIILDANQLRELIVGQTWSPFPKVESTERPDKVVAGLGAGKVVVVVDNSPFVIVCPTTLMDTLWAADDYYTNPIVSVLMRSARLIGTGAAVFLSPLYIGVEMFNPGLVRSDLALYLAAERAGIPLTPMLEVFFLEIMMEVLHEATVRLPSKVGSAATVVGGLIIGQAAVQARLVSGVVVIVAAISAVGSFTLPGQEMGQTWRAVKWFLLVAASLFGVYGVFAGTFMLFALLVSQDSMGTPYMAPLAPLIWEDLRRDSLLRQPWGVLRRRGRSYSPQDPDRTGRMQNEKYQDGGER